MFSTCTSLLSWKLYPTSFLQLLKEHMPEVHRMAAKGVLLPNILLGVSPPITDSTPPQIFPYQKDEARLKLTPLYPGSLSCLGGSPMGFDIYPKSLQCLVAPFQTLPSSCQGWPFTWSHLSTDSVLKSPLLKASPPGGVKSLSSGFLCFLFLLLLLLFS